MTLAGTQYAERTGDALTIDIKGRCFGEPKGAARGGSASGPSMRHQKVQVRSVSSLTPQRFRIQGKLCKVRIVLYRRSQRDGKQVARVWSDIVWGREERGKETRRMMNWQQSATNQRLSLDSHPGQEQSTQPDKQRASQATTSRNEGELTARAGGSDSHLQKRTFCCREYTTLLLTVERFQGWTTNVLPAHLRTTRDAQTAVSLLLSVLLCC